MPAALLATLISAASVAPLGDGAAMTLPAQRHIVRLDPRDGRPATWLMAVQQDGGQGRMLGFWRSTDEARSWSYYASIDESDWWHRTTADLVQVGMDVAVVYSYEGPDAGGSSRNDVWFQWWRWNGGSEWRPSGRVRVFDSTWDGTAYLRAELARDSWGRLWVWAQRLNADSSFTMVQAVSTGGGASFTELAALDTFWARPGGRLLAFGGGRMMLVYGTHGWDAAYMRVRNDSDPIGAWSSRQVAVPEGFYHGAALSAVADGGAGVHLVYKDLSSRLFYRRFEGGGWSGRQLVAEGEWALQPATTRVGSDLVIFLNQPVSGNTDYKLNYLIARGGWLSNQTTLDWSVSFKGYPAAPETLPGGVAIPCVYGDTPDANASGALKVVFAPALGGAPPPPPPPPPVGNRPPIGKLERLRDALGVSNVLPNDKITASGWAADWEDGATPTQVTVSIDGKVAGATQTSKMRRDIAGTYGNPAFANTGWALSLDTGGLTLGNHTVTAAAIDSMGATSPIGSASFSIVATRTVANRPPMGWMDQVANAAGSSAVRRNDRVVASGWAADWDDQAKPVRVTVSVDGKAVGTTTASSPRPDVLVYLANPAFPNTGWSLTFDVSTLGVGNHTVTATAIDSVGATTVLNSITLSVSP